MKLNKVEHITTVAVCKNYKEGNCIQTKGSCWFLHGNQEELNEEAVDSPNESGFPETKEKTPPD